ncbi:hypothetical protein N7508_002949 [Penicillium antarcticum]|uniref:uncharacterized protein n=1 Tax=Penicillium antarcticum TaxID=416450 RepID=UPI00238AA62A|nr:uncharacterized protein N7508_002949 [Penicillium antarcticum]KAJ5312119.1 hypothetical protein N7508_002949 [Penicillium antarcticum]
MSRKPPQRVLLNDYTLAWICALPIELAAAKSLLDHVHNPLPQPATDRNIYTLGSLSGLNVVVVCLPSGVYGTTSATGRGVPTKNVDIRLGDVVVSTPTGTYGGVVQYDYGKTCQQGYFQRMGSLNKPHESLLAAVSQIRCDNMLQEFPLGKIMSGVLQRHQKHFSSPDKDWLFRPTYEHQESSGDCSSCDKTQLVSRESRMSHEPQIHYGLIASGNRVMKDARTRDSIAEDIPVLCFEMEAAGLMDQLQCLVIRGICDYCDSHKHKEWQSYAALAAAAYAKALLSVLSQVKDIEMSDQDELKFWVRRDKGNDDLERNVLWLYGNPGIGKSTMAMTLAEELRHKKYFSDGNNVLCFFFCEATSERQREATSILRGLIYQIVTQHPPFLKWVLSKYDVRREALFASFDSLWAVLMDIGQAPTGPEIYCIIDALDKCEPESQEMLFHQIYQSFSKAGSTGLDPSRLHFLLISRPYPELKSRLSTFTYVDLGSFEEIKRDLKAMIKEKVKDLARRNNYTESVAQKVCQIFEEKADGTFLWVGIAHNELRLVQSRKVIERLQALPRGLYSLYRNLLDAAVISAEACGPDDYPLIKQILEIVAFAMRPLTIAEIAEACRLHLDTDSSSRVQFTRDIIDLCHLLIVVDNGHVRMLHRSVLEFLTMEVQGINPTGSNYALTYRCIEVILQNCRLGIDISTLKPSHGFLGYSVLHWPEHANLAQRDFNVPKEHDAFFQDRFGTWKWWLESYNHLKRGSLANLDTGISVIHVAARWGIIPLISSSSQNGLEDKDAQGQTPLLVAAQYSNFEAIKLLVESGASVRALNNDHQNVLHIICKNVHGSGYQIGQFLLNAGVSPYDCDKYNMTPFLYAIGNRDEELAQVFLQNGFDLTARIRRISWPGRTTVSMFTQMRPEDEREGAGLNLESGLTALHFSSLNACSEITAFLLRQGADPNAQSDIGDTPLHLAIRCRLLDRRYDDVWECGDYAIEFLKELITDHDSEEASDIYQAIDQARTHIVNTLLESETIDVNMANAFGDYPQHVIDFREDYALSILCKLIERGADISRLNGSGQSCLHLASKKGNLEVVRKFVDEGHDIWLEDSHRLSPFHYALQRGCLNVLQFLSTACDSALSTLWHSIDHHGRNPLHHHVSSIYCSVEMVKFLLELGCDVNQLDTKGNSSLGVYVGSFHLGFRGDIFFVLMDKGADPLWVNGREENLVHLLMHHRRVDTEILECLFRCGLDPAARDIDGKTFMHHGAAHGAFNKELVDFLQWRDVLDMHSRDSVGKTPLNYAEEKAHKKDLEEVLFDPRWDNSFYTLNEVARTLL